VLIEKIFYYGTAIWLLRAAGAGLARSVSVVAVVLASIEIAQIHLPGRTPEITDPILAVLIGFVLAMLSRPVRERLRTEMLE
jgi:VanZ family protein